MKKLLGLNYLQEKNIPVVSGVDIFENPVEVSEQVKNALRKRNEIYHSKYA